MIADATGGDLFSILTAEQYPDSYDDTIDVGQEEKHADARPVLSSHIEDLDRYDTIFLGFPNWWGDMPMAVFTFLDSYDFSGKTVIPFCAHGTSGLAASVRDIRAAVPNAMVLDAVDVQRPGMDTPLDAARSTVQSWLDRLEY